jgi:hypothetical protein
VAFTGSGNGYAMDSWVSFQHRDDSFDC